AVNVVTAGGGSAPPKGGSLPPPPSPPAISTLTPSAGPLGGNVVIAGSRFGSTAANNAVTFTGANGTRVPATVTQATSTSLTIVVPSQAVTGSVTVAVSGVVSNGVAFTVTTPVLSSVVPGNITTDPGGVKAVPLTLGGRRFAPGATVSFSGPAGDITP